MSSINSTNFLAFLKIDHTEISKMGATIASVGTSRKMNGRKLKQGPLDKGFFLIAPTAQLGCFPETIDEGKVKEWIVWNLALKNDS